MANYPAPLARLIKELSKLPGVGEKTAARLAFHLLKGNAEDAQALSDGIGRLKRELGICRTCFGLSEVDPVRGDGTQCGICQDPRREQEKICVVEEPSDVMAVE